jgi:hypothetical protein
METQQKLRLGRLCDNLFMFSKGFYGRDFPPKLLKMAAICAELIPEYIKNPSEYEELFNQMSEGFLREYDRWRS